jgi:hypothetical protein
MKSESFLFIKPSKNLMLLLSLEANLKYQKKGIVTVSELYN